MNLPPVDPYHYQQQSYQQYQMPYNNEYQADQGSYQSQYQAPYQQPAPQFLHAEPQYQQQVYNPPPAEAEVWNISQNKVSYVVSIAANNRRHPPV